jgi:NADP-dependent 3-hydroxy acid dehydrogenase YdfG
VSLDRDLTGTVVAITGATAGIGRATARALVAEGVADPAVNAAMVAAAQDRFGRLDSLVANAGIGAYGGIMSMTDDEIRTMDATNFLGTVFSVRAAVPTFLEQHGGDVVIVSSVAGLRGGPWEAVYAGTKFAQVGLAGSLDRELREHGIRVSTICPAAVSTEFAIGAGRNEGDAWLEDVLTAEDVADAIVTVLRQSRRLRTNQWVLRAMAEES